MQQLFPMPKAFYVDVDGTLLINHQLNTKLVSFIRLRKEEGYFTALWSARGLEYAQKIATKYNIIDLFDVILPKPGLLVDDKGWRWTQDCKRVRLAYIDANIT